MIAKKSISLLIVSAAFLLLPGVARAGDINIQTSAGKVAVSGPSGISIQSKGLGVNVRPTQWLSPTYYWLHRSIPSFPIRNDVWVAKPTQIQKTQITCNKGGYSHQSTRTSNSGNGTTQTYSSTSTKVCR